MAIFLSFIFLLFSSAAADSCDHCLHQAKVSFFSKAEAVQSGACGYGSLATGFYGGRVAAATPSLYKQGVGCGACFQIRCKNENLCSKEGTTVIVTDQNNDNKTDFVLSSRAFMAMAKKGMAQDVLKLGIANVEYKRVPCVYKNNLAIRVEESSKKPNYLAIKFLYQGGKTEILVVDVASQADSSNWNYMSRSYGAVWDTSRVPAGALQFRFVVTAGYDGKWYWVKSVLPADWKNGEIYNTGIQITDVAEDGCSSCNDQSWVPQS